MNELKIFENEEFGEVRTVTVENEPMFCLVDICRALQISNATQVAERLEEDERSMLDIGRAGKANFVTESGLYAVILRSDKPNAKKFRKWVTSQVLPVIRKTGGYVANDDLFIETYLPYADENTRLVFRTTLSTVRKQNEVIKKQKEVIEHKEDVIIGLVDDITLAEKRQILNRVVRYNHANYRERWSLLYREFENKYHIDLQQRFDRYNQDNKPKCKNKLEYIGLVMNKTPELYEIAAKLFENDVKELVDEMYGVVGV